jgi:hypothetical protein
MNLTPPLNDYITLYTKIFAVDAPPATVPVPTAPITVPTATINPEDYIYIDMSKITVPSIYVKVSDQKKIKTNGLNIGDGYSYLDFNKHIPTGVISFYRRDRSINNTLPMQYNPSNTKLYAIVNGKSRQFKQISPELQKVLDQIVLLK